jgi:aspartyl-tRNA(Asn)/glutamyl-tRNA(Gln) amidotransferase subunit C
MSDRLTADDVRSVAHLARLKLSDEEVERFTQQLGDVLTYVEQLNEVDTAAVEPMAHAIELSNVLRADEPRESLPRDAALANAPQTDGKYFLVPQILEGA